MKKESYKKQRSLGVVLQYAQLLVSIAVQLIFTPFMLRMLETNEYGIYSICASTIAYLSLLSMGVGASYIRWYCRYKKNEGEKAIATLNGLYLVVFMTMALIALILGIVVAQNAEVFLNATYSKADINTARILMIVLTINISASFPAALFNAYIASQERFVFQRLVNMGGTVLGPILNAILLALGYGSIGMAVLGTTVTLITILINVCYCLVELEMRISLKGIPWKALREIFAFSAFIAINQVIDQVNWQTDKLILGKMINGAAVAVYSVGASLNAMFISFSTAVSGVFVPKVNEIVSRNDDNMNEELTNLFIRVGRIQWFMLALILMGFCFFGKFFVINWAGSEYVNAYYVAMLLMAPVLIPLIQNLGIEIQRAKYLHRFRSVVYLFMALFNVAISVLLVGKMQEIGTALGTTISIIIANGLIMNLYYQKKCGINVNLFWKSIISTWKGLIIPGIVGVILVFWQPYSTMIGYGFWIIVFTSLYVCSIWRLAMNSEEKSFVVEFLERFVRK